ncbi:hypothetical protein KTE19_03535 [Lentilactobacillus sp. IMAU92037]|uniref:hypothetical protein n=1 Tax=Lentilactobacillus TaxID=2767893 RepID=UPI001C2C6D91|nr:MULTISPECIES: hypothetical protein [Lentilactobacillus]MBV0929795.1 hypothetical protein [Lentilactobacillus dabitei]MDM7515623.1 hypothetical protein [Lentilactobacillus sp. TOM.63]
MKTFFKIAGTSVFVAGAYLYSRKETPAAFVSKTKESIMAKKAAADEWKNSYEDFKKSFATFKEQLPELTKAINSIQRDMDDALFQIQPRIEEITKYSSNLTKKP